MEKYLWLVFLLILVFLIVGNGDTFKNTITSLSHAQIGAITALQGQPGNVVGRYING